MNQEGFKYSLFKGFGSIRMAKEKLPELGKIDPAFFRETIYPRLGAKDDSVMVKPQNGVDFGVVDLGEDVLVASTDPFYIAPALGWKKAAWFAVHILASDVAVSGIRPRYLTIDLNLPPGMSEDVLRTIWETVDMECSKLGISVLTGHTGRYPGCDYPMVGGATMLGIGKKESLIVPKAGPGDKIIVSKGPAVETTGLMAMQFPEFLLERHGKVFVRHAQNVFYQMSTVKDALTAAGAGGVTAMHDATECGVFGGLCEVAQVSGTGMRISLEDIVFQDVIRKTCECFDIDAYRAISEGTLIATARPENADAVVEALRRENIPASIIGEILPEGKGITVSEGGRVFKLDHPKVDPFWIRFEEYLKKQSSRS
jgi:hydrogenase expression/formation protein HypE